MRSTIRTKRILLSGYYGFGNAGDEAILQGAVQGFRSQGVEAVVLSHTPAETAKKFGVLALSRRNFTGILRGIWLTDLVLSGGGGLFQDKTSLKSLVYYLRVPVLAKLLGRKTMVFAQGIGPIDSGKGKRLTRWVCNRFVDRITVRDQSSKELLESLGVKREIKVTADLAFLLPVPSNEEIRQILKRFKLDTSRNPLLGIVLRKWPGIESKIPAIASQISSFSREKGAVPVLLAFQPGQDNEILKSFQQMVTVDHLEILEPLSASELLGVMSCFKLVVGMRYHSLVFAASNRIPFISIGYDPKVEHLTRHLGLPLLHIEELGSDKLGTALSEIWERNETYKEALKEQIPLLLKKAGENIGEALELLEKGV